MRNPYEESEAIKKQIEVDGGTVVEYNIKIDTHKNNGGEHKERIISYQLDPIWSDYVLSKKRYRKGVGSV